jgi:hypothetical protein
MRRDGAMTAEHSVHNVRTRPTRVGGHGEAQSIVVVHVPCTKPLPRYKEPAQYTLLCSHGNAVDVGQMMPIYVELGRLLNVHVVGCVRIRMWRCPAGFACTIDGCNCDPIMS